MTTETVTVTRTTSSCRWYWPSKPANAHVALLFAAVGICAAVGLGTGDWYLVEASSSSSSLGTTGSTFNTAYFGLRFGYFCNGPQSTVPYTSLSQNNGFTSTPCVPYTYRSQYLAAQYIHDTAPGATDAQKSAASDAMTAFTHLIGASGVITALLAVAVVIAGHQFLVNISRAHGYAASAKVPGKISLVILIILEALVIIFWVTIFPYNYFYNQEQNLLPGVTSYDTYHTLGLGFSIQVAGLLIGLAGLFRFPKAD